MTRCLVLVAIVAAACSASDPAATYVDDVEAVMQAMTADSLVALPLGAAPTRQQVSDVVEIRAATVSSLRSIEPPEDFAVEHSALVAALENLVTASRGFLDLTASLDADRFLSALTASADLDAFAETVATVCAIWESKAAASVRRSDLGC